jgi:hypothetical protein
MFVTGRIDWFDIGALDGNAFFCRGARPSSAFKRGVITRVAALLGR